MTRTDPETSPAATSGADRAAVEPSGASTPDATGPHKPASPCVTPEIGGPKGPDPTRYGDWERNGRCSDF
jgi:hypothetical protein